MLLFVFKPLITDFDHIKLVSGIEVTGDRVLSGTFVDFEFSLMIEKSCYTITLKVSHSLCLWSSS